MRDDGTPFGFTCPSPRRYQHQWYWDSCFHAIAWSHIDKQRAAQELRTLLKAGRPDGFVPHTAFWQARRLWRRSPLYATNLQGTATESIQTPFLAVAFERVDPDEHDLEALRRHARWLIRERDPDNDGLITILLPDESGLDDSPKYDHVYGHLAHWKPGYARLVQRCRRARYDAHILTRTTDEHVEDVLVNVAHALSLRALHRMTGEPEWDEHATRTEQALIEKCLDPKTGLFFDLAGRDETPIRISTWSSLTPLALPIPKEIRERLVDEHLLNPRRYNARFGVPSVSMEEPSFRPGFNAYRTWRGAAWMNTTWLLSQGLEAREAHELAEKAHAAVDRSGFREYYHPRTGSGHGEHRFGFSTLLLDLPARVAPPA